MASATLPGCNGGQEANCEPEGSGSRSPIVTFSWSAEFGDESTIAFYSFDLINNNTASVSPETSPLWAEAVKKGEHTPTQPSVDALFTLEGAKVGLFLPAMFLDEDNDYAHEANETIISIADKFLLYATDIDCSLWPDLSEGWSYATVDMATGVISSIDDSGEISFNNYISDSFIPNIEVLRADGQGDRVALIPDLWGDLSTTKPLLLDEEITGSSYLLTVPEWPIDEHLQPYDINGDRYSDWFYSVELFATYWDTDLSMDLSSEDEIATGVCLDGVPLAAVHTPNADTIEEAIYMTQASLSGGWSVWREIGDNWEPVELTEEDKAESGESCPPPSGLL